MPTLNVAGARASAIALLPLGNLELEPALPAAVALDHAQPHARVVGARERIGMIFLRTVADSALALVNDAVRRNVRLVDLDECERRAVGRPPIALVAIHLLGRDELREPAGLARLDAAGHLSRLTAAIGCDDPQLVATHECDLPAVGRERRIEGWTRFGFGLADEFSQRRIDAVLQPDLARQRDQHAIGVACPVVAGDTQVAHAQSLARELLFRREVVLADATAGRFDDTAKRRRLGPVGGAAHPGCPQLESKQLAAETVVRALEPGEPACAW